MEESVARMELVDICKRLYDRKLTVSAGGNMSVRLNDNEFLITPSGRNKGSLKPEELIKMDLDGNVLSPGKPSIEHKFHLQLYLKNSETKAVVHCHPLNCVALAVLGKNIRTALTPEGILLLGDVPMVDYQTPGSQELVDAVAKCSESVAMLMKKHGALTQGKSLEEAYNRMEELEFQAELQLLIPDAEDLPQDEIEKIRGM